MAKNEKKKRGKGGAGRSSGSITVRKAKKDGWEFVHPRCARDRAEDIEEVQLMINGGESDIATEELRWLLSGCSDFLVAHRLLGELALAEHNDLKLARGHFGHAYQLGLKALRRAKMPSPLPYAHEPNRSFFEAGKGLAHCLRELGKAKMAKEVLRELLQCDPTDPLGLKTMLD